MYLVDNIKTFPSNAEEALAMLYVTKTVPSTATPEDYIKAYDDALTRINAEAKRINDEKPKHGVSY